MKKAADNGWKSPEYGCIDDITDSKTCDESESQNSNFIDLFAYNNSSIANLPPQEKLSAHDTYRIDYILGRNLGNFRVMKSWLLPLECSDHKPVVVDIEVSNYNESDSKGKTEMHKL